MTAVATINGETALTAIPTSTNTTQNKPTITPSITTELNPQERRKLARTRRKARLADLRAKNGGRLPKKARPTKITKEERRAKFTKLAHERRDAKTDKNRAKDLICFKCRKNGHLALHCPLNDDGGGAGSQSMGGGICYKCGSTEHRLSECPKRKYSKHRSKTNYENDTDLPYAKCFVCNQMGHLSSQCTSNKERGVFVNGGSCRNCGSKYHIAAQCPDRKNITCKVVPEEMMMSVGVGDLDVGREGGGDDQPERRDTHATKSKKKNKSKVIRF